MMAFNGIDFDTSNIIQLTFTGNNYWPDWNFSGNEIAYIQSVCNDTPCGVWVNDSTNQNNFIIHGVNVDWHPFQESIIDTRNIIMGGNDIGDSLFLFSLANKRETLIKSIVFPNYENRYFKYSYDGKMIAFISIFGNREGVQICSINSDGTNLRKITYNLS